LVPIGTIVKDKDLVSISLNGLAPSCKDFFQGVFSHEHLPNHDKLWDNFV
jgi:hypothetical protein